MTRLIVYSKENKKIFQGYLEEKMKAMKEDDMNEGNQQ